jgi:hypothetical protein
MDARSVVIAVAAVLLPAAAVQAQAACGSQGYATVALGEALDQLRGARVFAQADSTRSALTRLEAALAEQIERDPDPETQRAAWRIAHDSVVVRDAASLDQHEQERAARSPMPAAGQRMLAERRLEELRRRLIVVAKLLNPRSVPACARERWEALHAMAVQATPRR